MNRRDEVSIAGVARNWWAVAVRGVAAIVFGLLALIVPGLAFAALVLLFGSYALVEGVFNVIAAVRGGGRHGRWMLVLEGLVSIVVGIVTFVVPILTALVLLYVVAAWAFVTGVLEIVAAVRLRRHITNEWWLGLGGALSIVFAFLLVLAPVAGALAITLWLGAYAVVFGVLMVALAVRLRRHRADGPIGMARAA